MFAFAWYPRIACRCLLVPRLLLERREVALLFSFQGDNQITCSIWALLLDKDASFNLLARREVEPVVGKVDEHLPAAESVQLLLPPGLLIWTSQESIFLSHCIS